MTDQDGPRGPVQAALERELCSCEAFREADGLRVAQASPRAPGELSVLLPETGDRADVVRRSLSPDVALDVVPVPPRVYLRLHPRFVHEAVVPAVLEQGRALGSSTAGLGQPVYVRFSSPNANKALHLGHLRNNALGMATANLFASQGHEVVRAEAVSDWGKHICKALVAYRKWGGDATPERSGMKPDHFVHDLYARYQREAEEDASLDGELESAMLALEAGDGEWRRLHRLVTGWAYEGIRRTYARIGTEMDAVVIESETFREATRRIRGALGDACRERADGSIGMDLSDVDLRDVTLVGQNGNPLLFAQFFGVSALREELFPHHEEVFLMGREWRPRVPELLEVLRRLGAGWAAEHTEAVFHGMVRSPAGTLGSRRGGPLLVDTVIDEVAAELERSWPDPPPTPALRTAACERLAVALLKYAFLRVRTEKDVLYDEEQLWGSTFRGFRRLVRAVVASADTPRRQGEGREVDGSTLELLLAVNLFPDTVRHALRSRDPSVLLRQVEDIATKALAARSFREDWAVRRVVGIVLRRGLALLNIRIPPLPPEPVPSQE